MLQAALAYAAAGWAVFPLRPRDKTPLGGHGFKDATTDAETIRAWWSRTPDANIGLPIPDGLMVVDVDGPTHADLPETLTQRTGRGSHHVYRIHGPVRQRAGVLEHVDTRVAGKGYIVGAPSIHPDGHAYEWVDGFDPGGITDAPSWVYGDAESEARRRRPVASGRDVIPKGRQTDTLVSWAGTMAMRGMSADAIAAALLHENSSRCQQPLPDAEVRTIAANIAAREDGRHAGAWPVMGPDAFQGLAGEIVDLVMPTTEGDPVAVLAAVLTWFGIAVGNGPHVYVGSTRHAANLYAVIVGDTAKARKGVSGAVIREVLRLADEDLDIAGGVSTGEGIIYGLRDPRLEFDPKTRSFVERDAGVRDKRSLIVESEFGRLLRVATRQASTLTSVLRQAWDGDVLSVKVKGDLGGYRATGAHVGLLGNVTREELAELLTRSDQENGFANRILWLAVRRSKMLPLPPRLGDLRPVTARLLGSLDAAGRRGEMTFDRAGQGLWVASYEGLATSRGGPASKLTDRSEAQARRLSLVYALLDGAERISEVHVRAALAVVEYAGATAEMLVGREADDPRAERVLEALRLADGRRLERSRVRAVLGGRATPADLDAIRDRLVADGAIAVDEQVTNGRPAEVWRLL